MKRIDGGSRLIGITIVMTMVLVTFTSCLGGIDVKKVGEMNSTIKGMQEDFEETESYFYYEDEEGIYELATDDKGNRYFYHEEDNYKEYCQIVDGEYIYKDEENGKLVDRTSEITFEEVVDVMDEKIDDVTSIMEKLYEAWDVDYTKQLGAKIEKKGGEYRAEMENDMNGTSYITVAIDGSYYNITEKSEDKDVIVFKYQEKFEKIKNKM